MDVLRLASLLEELPPERTRLLDNLGRLRREVGPVTPELSDALADHMNIRRGEVHEVVSFYSFLQVPVDAVRVCTGPVCDCAGARELAREHAGAIEVPCLGHCDLAPVVTARRRGRRPASCTRANDGAVARARHGATTTLADYEARGGLALLRDAPGAERIVAELKASGLAGYGGAGFPTGLKWEAVAARAGAARRGRERRRGRARDDQGPLRDGAAPAPAARGDADRDALRWRRRRASIYLREEYATARERLLGALDEFRAAGCSTASRSSSSSAPARTSAARRRRCSSRWRAGAGCRG